MPNPSSNQIRNVSSVPGATLTDALESLTFLAGDGTGDMLKAVYDSNNDGKVNAADTADSVPYSGVTGKPATFPPQDHTHPTSQVVGLDAALAGKEPSITPGTTAQYRRGDKTWQDFFTDVRAATLTGLSTATNAVITASDTVLLALGKLQKQITDNLATLTGHTGASSGAHAGTAISNTPAGGIAATTVQAAINELDSEKFDKTGGNVAGNVIVTGGNLGFGTGAGGTVTQATSKSTAVTLNKPTGQITMNNAALGAGVEVNFTMNNSNVAVGDNVVVAGTLGVNYLYRTGPANAGAVAIFVKNNTAGSLSEAPVIDFKVFKGATS